MTINAGSNSNGYGFIDTPPVYDRLVDREGVHMSGIFAEWLDSFVQTISGYLSQTGICIPQLTTTQRDSLVNPFAGQLIYNTTTDALQVFIITAHGTAPAPDQGDWKTITVS